MRVAQKSVKRSPVELTEADRVRIGEAREVLQHYGQYVDVAEMSDVAFEQRNVRTKSLDQAIAFAPQNNTAELVLVAESFYNYVWKGETGAEV